MALSSSSRLAVVASAALLIMAGVNFWVSCRFIEQQRLSQVAALLGRDSAAGKNDLAGLQSDLQIVAPGSVVVAFDGEGRQVNDARTPLPQDAIAWARDCAASTRKTCFRRNLIAGRLGSGSFDGNFAIVILARHQMTSLTNWILGISLITSCLFGLAIFWLANILILRPLRALQSSTHSVAVSSSSKLTYIRPCFGLPGLPMPFNRLLRPCQEIENLVTDLESMSSVTLDARRQVSDREQLHLEWLAYLSHDLGAPLSRILRRLELLEYSPELNSEEKDRTLNAIHIEITQLAEVIGSISQFAVLESDIDRTFVETDLAPLLEYALEVFECEASKKDIELDLRVAPDVGFVRIERSLMRRAIENLLSNSIRHTPEGGLISVNVERSGRMVCIRVTDTGTGISAEEMQKIFEFAFRGSGQTRVGQVGSLGLGLALVRRVAEVHNGKVAARNLDPQGAEFVITLPMVERPESSAEGSQNRR
jgi:signal transduction histidine kinase